MKGSNMRDKARATFGKTFFENTKEPAPAKNGAVALQKRANARPIPTYKVGGVVKSTPPGPTAAEREEARRQNERLKKAKVTPKEGKVIDSANRSEGGMYKKGGMAKGKPKDGLAVMIAIGKPMKGMKKPVKRAEGGKIAKKAVGGKAADRGPTTAAQRDAAYFRMQGANALPSAKGATQKEINELVNKISAASGAKKVSAVTGSDETPVARGSAKQMVQDAKNRASERIMPRPETRPVPVDAPKSDAKSDAMPRPTPMPVPATSTRVDPNRPQTLTLKNVPQTLTLSNVPGSPPRPIKKGGAVMKPVKRAVGGAGKTRKGMCK